MALANHKPTSFTRVEPQDSSVVADPKKHEIYDHRSQPLYSLDAFLQGSPWAVIYFRQRLAKGDMTKKLDVNVDPAYQSYDKYEKMELLVQSAISSSYRDKEALIEVTGSALVYSFMQPNVDDYFITESNLGRLALFRVVNVNRRTHERESVYIIEYQIEEEITPENILFKDIHRKVVKTFVFSKQRLIENKNPILLKKAYDVIQNLHFSFINLAEAYYRDFFNKQTFTLQVPGQVGRHIDPFILEFFLDIVPLETIQGLSRMKYISLNNDSVYSRPNIWNVLLNRSLIDLEQCFISMGKYNPQNLPSSFFSRSGNFASADYVVAPFGEDGSLMSSSYIRSSCQAEAPRIELDYAPTTNAQGKSYHDLDLIYEGEPNYPAYLEVNTGGTYVFPKQFYKLTPSSILEIMVHDYLRLEPINLDQLSFLVSLYPSMPRLEQFYYGPILLLLIKESERGTYV